MSEEITHGVGTSINHEAFGQGVIVEVSLGTYTVWFKHRGEVEVSHRDDRMEVTEAKEVSDNKLTLPEVEKALEGILRKWSDVNEVIDLGKRWEGGTMILKPGVEGQKSKEFSIESFFHKIVMTRDRLRVMEQRINAHKVLTDEEKVNLQQYISRIYGSLTTFNVLFADSGDHFKGS